ncbi:hypothetical protein [Rhodoferax ferrireducens]|uniref:hypothetical protein n=1 Tax=Rhodoferax ferrireducens TaxID=192843 RepID=UPI000E0D5277|nr:hypothetical protein [Rhodoferax ferrireducens]
MKVLVIGLDFAEGVSTKSGTPKPYSIGKLFVACKIDGQNARGAQGTEYQVDVSTIKKINHLPLPFEADLHVEDVMRFGKRESKVFDVVPTSLVKPAASAPGTGLRAA